MKFLNQEEARIINNEMPTMAIRNAGKSATQKIGASIPPKLHFDVLEKNKLKTQSVALASVIAKAKGKCFKIPHYA